MLIPDAMPALRGSTTPTAVDARGGFTIPLPSPATTKPGIRWVHEEPAVSPRISSRPMPTSSRPGPISQRTGMRADSRPAGIAVSSEPPVISASRQPHPSAEKCKRALEVDDEVEQHRVQRPVHPEGGDRTADEGRLAEQR